MTLEAGAKAIAKASTMHSFPEGAQITLVRVLPNDFVEQAYIFEGVNKYKDHTTQILIASEFDWRLD